WQQWRRGSTARNWIGRWLSGSRSWRAYLAVRRHPRHPPRLLHPEGTGGDGASAPTGCLEPHRLAAGDAGQCEPRSQEGSGVQARRLPSRSRRTAHGIVPAAQGRHWIAQEGLRGQELMMNPFGLYTLLELLAT